MPVTAIYNIPGGIRVQAKSQIAALPVRIVQGGPQGAQGPPGPIVLPDDGEDSWVPGPQGIQGLQGVPGPSGPQGPPGIKGWDGEEGETYVFPGPQGAQGAPGMVGAQGAPGIPGQDGIDGDDGFAGPPGNQGIAGNPGAQGPALGLVAAYPPEDGDDGWIPGPAGAQGVQGVPGPPGTPGGPPGPQGPPGTVFFWGAEDGDDGWPGPPGAAGTSSGGGDPWLRATMTAPPTVAGGTWTTAYATSSAPTPHFEDWTAGVTGVRLRVLTTAGNAAHAVYGVFQSRPGAAYDLIARFRLQKIMTSSFNRAGLMMRESGTSKVLIFGLDDVTNLISQSYANLTTTSNRLVFEGGSTGWSSFDFWLKIHDDHTANLTFYCSLDGNYWVVLGTKAYTASGVDFTTAPNQVGFGFDVSDGNVNTEMVLDCGSFFAG